MVFACFEKGQQFQYTNAEHINKPATEHEEVLNILVIFCNLVMFAKQQ